MVILLLAGWRVWGFLAPGSAPVPAGGSGVAVAGGVNTDQFRGFEIPVNWAELGEGGGARDPFQLGGRPAPPAPPPLPEPAPVVRPVERPAPAPPPPLPLKYVGYGRAGGGEAPLQAFFVGEDGLPYAAVAGQTLPQERYRVLEFTPEYAVVEDVQSGRSERLVLDEVSP
jgi:hypothetical protein